MKRSLILAPLIFLCGLVQAQVTASGGLTPTQYVNNVLLGGGVTAFNVTFTGYANGIGTFTATPGTSLGFSSGLYLTSGSIFQNDVNGGGLGFDGPMGPADQLQSVSQNPSIVDDYDLHAALVDMGYDTTFMVGTNITYDVNVLEFDFIPTTDSISFRYIFASEEYNDYVADPATGGYNDIFAFLLRGVSPAAAAQYPAYENIARVPNTNVPVSIFSVNNGYSPFGVLGPGPCINCAYYTDNAFNVVDVVYDGLTTVLTARAAVICGETYHIKLSIADVGDPILDSGVFIEGGSFTSSAGVTVIPHVDFGPSDTSLVENCNQGTLTVTRGGDLNVPLNVSLIYSGSADPNADFTTALPPSITFAAGQNTLQFNLAADEDGVNEGTEHVTIGFITASGCAGNTFDTTFITLSIIDKPALSVNAGADIAGCNAAQINQNITAVPSGGIGPYGYNWNTGPTTATITVNGEGDYIVTVQDQCLQTATDTVTASIVVPQPLDVTLSPDQSICAGNPVTLTATVIGGNGTVNLSWSNGASGNPITISPQNSITLTVTAQDACGLTATDHVAITVIDVSAEFSYGFISEGTAAFSNESSPAGLSSSWDFGDGFSSTEYSPTHTYQVSGVFPVTLTVSNALGCTDQVTRMVQFSIPSMIFIPNAFTPNGDGMNDDWRVSMSYIKNFSLLVFDRWGEKVFQSEDLYDRWEGTWFNNGKPLKSDHYVYRIQYTELNGDTRELIGSVSLIR
ncbi:MAG: choice-of-anchor L domain-containing protein [Bacteroidia bacterium]|nr:choice-of-anchor L domain-containing protein [Bacteroidia bacterium]